MTTSPVWNLCRPAAGGVCGAVDELMTLDCATVGAAPEDDDFVAKDDSDVEEEYGPLPVCAMNLFPFLNLTPLHRRRIRYDENYESPDEEGGAPSKKGDKKKGKASRKRDDDDDEDEDGDDDDAEPAPKKAKVSKEKAPAKSKESAPKAKKPAPSKTKTTDPTKSGKGKGDDEALKRKVRPGFRAPLRGPALCASHAAAPLTTHTQMADILDEEDED